MKQHDLAITGGDVVIGDDVAKLNVGVRDGRISADQRPAHRRRRDDRRHRPDRHARGDRRALPLLRRLRLGDVRELHARCRQGRRDERRSTCRSTSRRRSPPTAAEQARDALRTPPTWTTPASAATWPRTPTEMARWRSWASRPSSCSPAASRLPGCTRASTTASCSTRCAARRRLGLPTTVHCENAHDRRLGDGAPDGRGPQGHGGVGRRAPVVQRGGRRADVALIAEVTGARVIIAHVSSPQTVEAITASRARGGDVWAETCHHYLCTTKEQALEDTRLKWNPPTRDEPPRSTALEARARGSGALGRPATTPRCRRPPRTPTCGAVAGRRQRRGGVLPGVRHGGAPPRDVPITHIVATRVQQPGEALRPRRQGRDRDRRRRRLRDRRDQRKQGGSTLRSSSTTTRRSGPRSTAWS